MSILINKNTRLIVQGITGRDGGFHATKMKAYGTNVVGGTSPGKAGQEVNGIPVFNTVKDAVEATQANTSVIFVPAAFAKDAMMEAADAGIQLIICITEGVPTLDVVQAYNYIQQKGAKLIGPNCPGLISPEESMVGIMPTNIFKKGGTGVIRHSNLRSGVQPHPKWHGTKHCCGRWRRPHRGTLLPRLTRNVPKRPRNG